jgi:hypothetical protein
MIANYSSTNQKYTKDFNATGVGNYALGGRFRNLTSPCMWYYNGSTYWVGYESNVYLNQVWLLKETNSNIEYEKVGIGTDGQEPLNHPTPLLFIDENTGYIYVIQNEFHEDRFLVWKSDSPERISTSFVDYFDTSSSYLGLIDYNNIDCTFVTRSQSGGDIYSQSLLFVNLDTPSSYGKQEVSLSDYNSTNVRHYPCMPLKYGTSIYTIWGINKRQDTPIKYYCTDLLVAINGDFQTIFNIGLSFSKTVTIDGDLTNTELDDNYNRLGNPLDETVSITEVRAAQINDWIYTTHLSDELTNVYTISRFNAETNATNDLILDISDIYNDGLQYHNMTGLFYDGSQVIMCVKRTSVTSEYHIDLELTTLTFFRDIETPDGEYLGYPQNLDKVPRNKRFSIAGRGELPVTGAVPYTVTTEK